MTGTARIEIILDDITTVEADAIVNAANVNLTPGGGVCGAIFRAAGEAELTEACRHLAPIKTGEAVLTPAFGIKTAKHIIHAVGPIWHCETTSMARTLLRRAYRSAIDLAATHGCASIAFPVISTGFYGYPLNEACEEAVEACNEASAETGMLVKLVAIDGETYAMLTKHATGQPVWPATYA